MHTGCGARRQACEIRPRHLAILDAALARHFLHHDDVKGAERRNEHEPLLQPALFVRSLKLLKVQTRIECRSLKSLGGLRPL